MKGKLPPLTAAQVARLCQRVGLDTGWVKWVLEEGASALRLCQLKERLRVAYRMRANVLPVGDRIALGRAVEALQRQSVVSGILPSDVREKEMDLHIGWRWSADGWDPTHWRAQQLALEAGMLAL